MLLVQISDTHCGSMFRNKVLQDAIREINAMSPDVVLVTGDLTEDGLMS
ncbi:MAG: metallophosphoesterase [Candidatus Bathyarchaeota archaeon]|nr:metallophosphoesterase [Candidatus Bathyarchaeota archaeon]MDH5495077.1 metallophosphoesterase [Candidatus Bathyarchaeota archaeon]